MKVKLSTNLNRMNRKIELSPGWTHILFGLKFMYDLKNWRFNVKADLGGFSSGFPNFSYKIQLLAYYKFNEKIAMRFGWTDMDIKFDDIYANDRLIINTHLSGPNAGISLSF